ncbi:SAM-dependent methyltransferase [Planotetraspora sp. A-T 1434]|uniref:SAM-dependent methyltransferase n=1 Tax=Planotetraspora sp. A-T 1434 TaxID=2979219 RepID=UPI0021C1AF52|nr:SAM-dependent methyltransferase [Planotetraspora sp. A-T 1434]MCT9930413.1 SAM-dependent methyltransferase [Planotetraspora sp. A-T 1434]
MSTPPEPWADKIQSHLPHSARVWNYLLGGKDNYVADRQVGDTILQMFPGIARIARLQRYFLARAVRFLAGEVGIRQFLDIGTGLPTVDNTHEVAQRVAPESRIVYVDNDPLVLVHAQALLTTTPQGVCDYIDADVRDPDRILAEAARTLDLSQPIALMMLGVLGQIPDSDQPETIVHRLLEAAPAGSYLALSDGTDTNQALNEAIAAYNANSASSYHLRRPDQIARFFTGLELIEPGLVATTQWRPELGDAGGGDPSQVDAICGVARKG